MSSVPKINLDSPRWDQTTYIGRARHFFTVTNPLNLRYTTEQLDEAKDIVFRHRSGKPQKRELTLDELWKAKHMYDSAFHPINGEKTFILGRMSAQVPMNMFITGSMMTFYKSSPAVIFWQWVNQSFNALVNYCNRSDASLPLGQLGTSYIVATSGAVGTALALNKLVQRMPNGLIARFVPFVAVASANCINIPVMRSKELGEGIRVFDAQNNMMGLSKIAAKEATISVIISRVIMAAPSMALTPIVMNILDKKGMFRGRRWLEPVVGVGTAGLALLFATPLACALFVQMAPIKVKRLEREIQDEVDKTAPSTSVLYYNKGL